MHKTPEVSAKARSGWGYCKHLRPVGKRVAHKSTRRITKRQIQQTVIKA